VAPENPGWRSRTGIGSGNKQQYHTVLWVTGVRIHSIT
jgi:hypothetical protein